MAEICKNVFDLSMQAAFHDLDQELQHVMTLLELEGHRRPLQMAKRRRGRNWVVMNQ
jgi:hypothetical protein